MTTTLFSDLRQAVVAIVMTSLILGSGGLLLFVESVRIVVIDTMQKPQPLWVSIALALIVMIYTYLKTRSLLPPVTKTKFLTVKNTKWKVLLYGNKKFHVEEAPYCLKHDLSFVKAKGVTRCPGLPGDPCDVFINNKDHHDFHSSVKSLAENKIRNGEQLC